MLDWYHPKSLNDEKSISDNAHDLCQSHDFSYRTKFGLINLSKKVDYKTENMADSHYSDPNSHLGCILGTSHLQKWVSIRLGLVGILLVILLGFVDVRHYHKGYTYHEQSQMDQWHIQAVDEASSTIKLLLSDMYVGFLSIDQLSQVLLKLLPTIFDVRVLNYVCFQRIRLTMIVFCHVENWLVLSF